MGLFDNGTTQDYNNALARVRGGGGSRKDVEMVEKEAKQAGSRGNAAREALKNAGK